MSALWHPFTAMQDWQQEAQLSIAAAEGNYLIDTEGRRYFDGVSSLWTNVHGHRHPRLDAALREQLDQVAHSTLLGLSQPKAEALAERLVEIAPAGLKHVFYSDSGSTAVEIGLKQAFQYWQLVGRPSKTRFLRLEEAYHGDTIGAVSVGGIDLFHQIFGPLLFETLPVPSPSPFRHPSAGTPQAAMRHSLDALEGQLREHADDIAAFILEPLVQGAGGILTHPRGFLAEAAALCAQHDVLLIVDEVATGFGRTGRMFACEHEGVSPDLLCLAKGITGGYLPLAATLSSDRIYEAFLAPRQEGKTFFHGHTYTGNALACAVALASLEVFKEEDTIAKMQPKISLLEELLANLAEHPNVGDVRQRGFMMGVELVADRRDLRAFPAEALTGHQVCMRARQHGVIIRNLGDVVVLMPPLSSTEDDLGLLLSATQCSIEEVCGA